MKRAVLLVVAAIAVFLLIGASPVTIASGGDVNVRVADGDPPGGG